MTQSMTRVVRRPGAHVGRHVCSPSRCPRATGSPAGPAYDLVVYGGTAGGVVTAVAAAREGLTVALLEPGRTLAAWSRAGWAGPITAARKSSAATRSSSSSASGKKYGRDIEWHFEPHVAEAVFGEMIKEAGVHVFLGHQLAEKSGVRKSGTPDY